MNFDFTDDQHEIKRTARDLLTKRSTWEKVREAAEGGRYDDELWRELGELGWPGIAIAEEHGGQGLGVVELVILLEELGYALRADAVPAAARSRAWRSRRAGSRRAAGALAAGRWRAASCAARSAPPRPGPRRRRRGRDRPRRRGRRAAAAGRARDAGVRAGRRDRPDAPPRARRRRRRGRWAAATARRPALDRARIAVAAELVGVCQRALEMSVAYVKDRKQFDTPVGAFQAVSHRCAQMLRDTEMARSATYYAAWAADADPERLAEAAGAREGRGLGGRPRRDGRRDPGPRRHRLHLGGRRALALQARADRRGAARRRGRPPRAPRARLAAARLAGARPEPRRQWWCSCSSRRRRYSSTVSGRPRTSLSAGSCSRYSSSSRRQTAM